METLYEADITDSEEIGVYENQGENIISIETNHGIIDVPQDISIKVAKAVLGIK